MCTIISTVRHARSNFAAVCRALGSVEPEQLAGYGRSRGITDRCTARSVSAIVISQAFSVFTPFPQLICCLFLPMVLQVACTHLLLHGRSLQRTIRLLHSAPETCSIASISCTVAVLAFNLQHRSKRDSTGQARVTRRPNFDLSTRRDGAVDTCTKVRPSTGRLLDPVTHIWPGFWAYYCRTGRPRSGLYGQKVNDSGGH